MTEKVMVKRQTISFNPEIEQDIEDYRRRQTPIPSFNQAVLELIEKGLKR